MSTVRMGIRSLTEGVRAMNLQSKLMEKQLDSLQEKFEASTTRVEERLEAMLTRMEVMLFSVQQPFSHQSQQSISQSKKTLDFNPKVEPPKTTTTAAAPLSVSDLRDLAASQIDRPQKLVSASHFGFLKENGSSASSSLELDLDQFRLDDSVHSFNRGFTGSSVGAFQERVIEEGAFQEQEYPLVISVNPFIPYPDTTEIPSDPSLIPDPSHDLPGSGMAESKSVGTFSPLQNQEDEGEVKVVIVEPMARVVVEGDINRQEINKLFQLHFVKTSWAILSCAQSLKTKSQSRCSKGKGTYLQLKEFLNVSSLIACENAPKKFLLLWFRWWEEYRGGMKIVKEIVGATVRDFLRKLVITFLSTVALEMFYYPKLSLRGILFCGFLMWDLVEKEIVNAPRLGSCHYASHLPCLLKYQQPGLFEGGAEVTEVLVPEPDSSMDASVDEEDCEGNYERSFEEHQIVGCERQGPGLSLGLGENGVFMDGVDDYKGFGVAMMIDTEGSQMCLIDHGSNSSVKAEDGSMWLFTTEKFEGSRPFTVQLNYEEFSEGVMVGDELVIDGGMATFEVVERVGTNLRCKCTDPGLLLPRAKLSFWRDGELVGKSSGLPTLTTKDWADIAFGISEGVDFIVVSFVKDANDIKHLKNYLSRRSSEFVKVLTKIESIESLENLGDIIEASDGIMVARGDLGVHIPLEQIPSIQEEITCTCRQLNKPVIVASQLLESMIEYPTPTRAEVADVSEAVRKYADALMLSGESAVGSFAEKALSVLRMELSSCEENRQSLLVQPRLMLLRKGNLFESMLCSSYIATKLKTWSDNGMKKLKFLLARMGFPLIDCQKKFQYMSMEVKQKMKNEFERFLPEHGPGVLSDSINTVQPNLFLTILQQFWIPNLKPISGFIESKLASVASTRLI